MGSCSQTSRGLFGDSAQEVYQPQPMHALEEAKAFMQEQGEAWVPQEEGCVWETEGLLGTEMMHPVPQMSLPVDWDALWCNREAMGLGADPSVGEEGKAFSFDILVKDFVFQQLAPVNLPLDLQALVVSCMVDVMAFPNLAPHSRQHFLAG